MFAKIAFVPCDGSRRRLSIMCSNSYVRNHPVLSLDIVLLKIPQVRLQVVRGANAANLVPDASVWGHDLDPLGAEKWKWVSGLLCRALSEDAAILIRGNSLLCKKSVKTHW